MNYVIGIGKTRFGELGESLPELAYQAIVKCLEDAESKIEDIDGLIVSNFIGGVQASHLHLNSVIAGCFPGFHKPSFRVEAACASGGMAVYQGLNNLGKWGKILIVGVEKMSHADVKLTTKNIAMAGDRALDQNVGLNFAASYALIAQQHMLKFGTKVDDLTLVSLKNHNNAELNPLAHFTYKKVTREMIEESKVVASPLRMFDCSPISDGAAAILISTERNARAVEIAASAAATDTISLSQRNVLTSFNAAHEAAKSAYHQCGLSPSKIDVMELHDCFTIAELVAMEDVGVCRPGESKDWLRNGKTQINGTLPVNPDGGLKASGHPIGATGVSQIVEIVQQLRGEAGKHQIDGAGTGLAHNVGGVGGTAAVHILKKIT